MNARKLAEAETRIIRDVESGHRDAGDHLLEHLAAYGVGSLDVQDLADQVLENRG